MQPMDLVDEENFFVLQVGEDRREISGPFDHRPGCGFDSDSHFLGDEEC